MRSVAITQAMERLERAKSALSRMERAALFSVLLREWDSFVHAAGLVYSKLGEGAKGCAVSTSWMGRKRQDRKNDELLAYVHHARNSEEHGLETSIGHAYTITVTPGAIEEYFAKFDDNGDLIFLNAELQPTTKRFPLTGALKPVTNSKYGDVFLPPLQHLGQPLNQPTAFEVARLAVTYLEGLIAEATRLPQRP